MARWGVVTGPIGRPNAPHLSRPARFERNCFTYDAASIEIWFMHRRAQSYGAGESLDLRIWPDAYGLAFAFRPPASAHSLVCGVADGRYAQCSAGFAIEANTVVSQGGVVFDSISRAALSEISICPRGACPGTACWHAANVPHGLPAHAAAVLPHWLGGRVGLAA
ncbi:HK97 family phage prohead protease [Sphingomonas sp. Leaf357]|uniref:HK97 family phage prohead protease n=1 Tax=Sphingomonas sp. Leaf357 TaxID=1736350 RepID=UPI003FA6BC92